MGKRKTLADTEETRKKQHASGTLTSRERIDLLVDPGSFEELDAFFESFPDEHFSRQYGFWRSCVEQVIYRYLDCGDLHNGFARVKCNDCGYEYLLAFSCKRRHFCPSCHQKRVVELGTKDRSRTALFCESSPSSQLQKSFRVIPTKARIQSFWFPAFAGVTE